MKALLTGFALLSFVAASTVPFAAEAATHHKKHTKVVHHHVKKPVHKVAHHTHKRVVKKTT